MPPLTPKKTWQHWYYYTGSNIVYPAQHIMAAKQLESIVLLPDTYQKDYVTELTECSNTAFNSLVSPLKFSRHLLTAEMRLLWVFGEVFLPLV